MGLVGENIPRLAFRAREGGTGWRKIKLTIPPLSRVLSEGGMVDWLEEHIPPPSRVSSEGGDGGLVGGKYTPSVSHFE